MRPSKHATVLVLAGSVLALLSLSASSAAPPAKAAPRDFFGIAPQTALTEQDAEYMRAGRIGSVRWAMSWESAQPTANGGFNWDGFDEVVEVAARHRLRVLPVLYGSPSWLTREETTLPVANARQRRAWAAFVQAAVERYGPRGSFWPERAQVGVDYSPPVPKLPIRTWQIWNEANFFYFTFPVSPSNYARTLRIASQAVKRVDPGAEVLLSGLFGDPTERGRRGMAAADFLEALYRVPGIKQRFDAVALHPYAVDAETLAELSEELREVVLDNRDPRAGLYITEMGWGSQNNFRQVAFEQGKSGQVRQLRDSYAYLLSNRGRLNLKGTYWFSWKDVRGSCSFCDSVGLFRSGLRFKPKPSWRAFVQITGGRPRP